MTRQIAKEEIFQMLQQTASAEGTAGAVPSALIDLLGKLDKEENDPAVVLEAARSLSLEGENGIYRAELESAMKMKRH